MELVYFLEECERDENLIGVGYDGRKCEARIWGCRGKRKGNQCSRKKNGSGCFCTQHQNIVDKKGGGVWWLGKVTEPRPENPYGPPHLPEKRQRTHKW